MTEKGRVVHFETGHDTRESGGGTKAVVVQTALLRGHNPESPRAGSLFGDGVHECIGDGCYHARTIPGAP